MSNAKAPSFIRRSNQRPVAGLTRIMINCGWHLLPVMVVEDEIKVSVSWEALHVQS